MKSTDDRKLFGSLIGASAASGDIATIPQTQATAGDGTASVALGFPPETFIARAAGGEPPRGQDMNGLLNLLSGAVQVLQAGYLGAFDSSFAQSIGGYPAGAIVSGSTAGTFWVSTADANVSTPGATGATWQSLFNGLAVLNGSNTFTGAQNITGALNVTGTITALVASSTQKITLRRGSTYGGVNSYDGSNWHYLYVNDDDTVDTAKGTLAFDKDKANLAGGNTLTGNQIITGSVRVMESSLQAVKTVADAWLNAYVTDDGFLELDLDILSTGATRAFLKMDGNGLVTTSGGTLVFTNQFAASLSQAGYQKLPSGLIEQWGYVPSSSTTANFPVTFPNACLNIVIADAGTGHFQWGAYPTSTSTFEYATGSGNNAFWRAIGY
ncbi:gp53-like domain-containing protein [Acetobacter okinawensis]|uniref:gp53-like domain-containing protein n=1 Tax=Acetobacter okinawensis TaxID=1076594 RepID=UPI0004718888|nr:hypothetical protein [Acetobacter okinawensis]